MTRRVRFTPLLAAGLFALAGPGVLRAADVPFVAQPPVTAAADGARFAGLADLDGDGDGDVVSASESGDTIAWHERTSGGSWIVHTVATGVDGASALVFADVDGDGDLDVVSAAAQGDTVGWHSNTGGNGQTWERRTISTAANGVVSIAAADIDRDGDVDVVAGLADGARVDWHENAAGNGTTWVARTVSAAVGAVWSVAVADVDGDGDPDVASASAASGAAWHENAGNGAAWTPRAIATVIGQDTGVLPRDLDRDGDVDVVAVATNPAGDDRVGWYENTAGNGAAWTSRTISTAVLEPSWVDAADVDADGDVDLAAASRSDDRLVWFENLGGAAAFTARAVATSADGPRSFVAADVDDDGDLDLLSASSDDDEVAWYRNETIHPAACFLVPPAIATATNGARSAVAADVDGDGDLDALSALFGDDAVLWHENTAGNASAWVTHTVATGVVGANAVAAADLDRDGDVDAISVARTGDRLDWHENVAGNGTLWTAHTIHTPLSNAWSAAPADVDGDGDLDVLSLSRGDGRANWHENTAGNGSAWTRRTIATGVGNGASIVGVDVDADGDLDAVTSSITGSRIAWYENVAGNGTTWTLHEIDTAVGAPSSAVAADVDGDGDLDALSSGELLDDIVWHDNTAGTGLLWTPHTISTIADNAQAVAAADLDGDGDVDAASLGLHGPVAWHENAAADGSVWVTRTVTDTAAGAYSLRAADLDGDGDPDLLAALRFANEVRWYEARRGELRVDGIDQAPAVVGINEIVPTVRLTLAAGRGDDHPVELVSLGLLLEQEPGDPLTSAEANAIFESLRLYRDANGDGVLQPGLDLLVASEPTLNLTAGVHRFFFADGTPAVQVGPGTPAVFFVAVALTPDANQQAVNTFRITHLATGPSATTAEDAALDRPVLIACPADFATRVIGPIVPVTLLGFTVE